MNKNEEFTRICKQDLQLEDIRKNQYIKPLLNSLGAKRWGLFKIHSKPQIEYKIDGYIKTNKLILIENKCIVKDWSNLFLEMYIDRDFYRECGWATRPIHHDLDGYPIYLINAYETFIKIYDLRQIKTWVASIDETQFKLLGGKVWHGQDKRFGGEIYGWNAPFWLVEKFEIKDFKKVVWEN